MTDITGFTFEEWTEREGLFAKEGENGDLASLGHFELLDAFFRLYRLVIIPAPAHV